MKAAPQPKPPGKVGDVVRQRLKELKRSAAELAEAVQVPVEYIDDLISGRRRPPLPQRTDIYERMTPFLRLARNELANCARAQRASRRSRNRGPATEVGRILLDLCEPATLRELRQRRADGGDAEILGFLQRLLEIAQGSVRRLLDDQVALRIAAAQRGSSFLEMRLKVLEFLDATPDTLTLEDLAEFVQPRISRWDVDLDTGVLRVILRPQEPRERFRRTPSTGR